MANEVILNTIFQLKRGYSEAWSRNNPILRAGEPGYELDTGKLKIGDGAAAWNDLTYFGGSYAISADNKSIAFNNEELEIAGFADALAGQTIRKTADGALEWFTPTTAEGLEALAASVQKVGYEVISKPENSLVDNRDKEVRIMCPADTAWTLQQSGANSDPYSYYIGFRAYAPESAVSFKEDLAEIISDNTMYYFEGNDFAGIDQFNRKYSVIWLPVAKFDETTGQWVYHGAKSSKQKFIGWYYSVEWYDKDGKIINADTIRINLSNEDCHNMVADYYMGEYQKLTDSISVSRLINDENTVLIFDGGSAEDII